MSAVAGGEFQNTSLWERLAAAMFLAAREKASRLKASPTKALLPKI